MQPDNPQDTTPLETSAPQAPQTIDGAFHDDDVREPTTRVILNGFEDASLDEQDEQDLPPIETVKWRAQEYISPDKNALWYIGLGVVVVAVILLDFFFIKAYTPSLLILAIAAVLIVMSVRPPRMIDYTLSDKGLYIGEQLVDLEEYKAFGVVHDGKENSVMLIPIKRFKPGLSVYFPLETGESIVDHLGERLPMQEIHPDFVDSIVRILRL